MISLQCRSLGRASESPYFHRSCVEEAQLRFFLEGKQMLKSCRICGRIHPDNVICPLKKNKKNDSEANTFRGSKAWKRKRALIKERDKYMCVYCRHVHRELTRDKFNYEDISVHHIVPIEENYDRRLDDDNLITLCRYHHEQAESGKISRQELFDLI